MSDGDTFNWMEDLTADELKEEIELFEATISSSQRALKAAMKTLAKKQGK